MNSIDKIILHVGVHKTATTSVQSTLYNDSNQWLLKKKGILYPRETWIHDHNEPIISRFYNFMSPELYEGNIIKGFSREASINFFDLKERDLRAEIETSDAKTLVISAECISILSEENFKELFSFIHSLASNKPTIEIVAFVRNRISYEASGIQNRIRDGVVFEQVVNNKLKNKDFYQEMIVKFLNITYLENVSLNVYKFEDAIQHPWGPVGFFLQEVLGFESDEVPQFNIIKANQGFSRKAIEIIDYMNKRSPYFIEGKANVDRMFRDTECLAIIQGEKYDLPIDVKRAFSEISKSDNQWLFENVGVDYRDIQNDATDGNEIEYQENMIESIYLASKGLSPVLRSILIEYLEMEVQVKTEEETCLRITELVEKIRAEDAHRTVQYNAENQLLKTLMIDRTVERSEFYRLMALFHEDLGDINSALNMIEEALRFRPHDYYVYSKYKEYQDIVSKDAEIVKGDLDNRNDRSIKRFLKKFLWK